MHDLLPIIVGQEPSARFQFLEELTQRSPDACRITARVIKGARVLNVLESRLSGERTTVTEVCLHDENVGLEGICRIGGEKPYSILFHAQKRKSHAKHTRGIEEVLLPELQVAIAAARGVTE
jgi:hypothetical protein